METKCSLHWRPLRLCREPICVVRAVQRRSIVFWLNYIRCLFWLFVNICVPLTFFLSSFSFHRERSREHHHKSRSKDSRSEKSVTINTPPAEPLLGDSSHRGEQFQVGLDAMALTELSHSAFTVCHMGASNTRWDLARFFSHYDELGS